MSAIRLLWIGPFAGVFECVWAQIWGVSNGSGVNSKQVQCLSFPTKIQKNLTGCVSEAMSGWSEFIFETEWTCLILWPLSNFGGLHLGWLWTVVKASEQVFRSRLTYSAINKVPVMLRRWLSVCLYLLSATAHPYSVCFSSLFIKYYKSP
jgi:hypothetical protein